MVEEVLAAAGLVLVPAASVSDPAWESVSALDPALARERAADSATAREPASVPERVLDSASASTWPTATRPSAGATHASPAHTQSRRRPPRPPTKFVQARCRGWEQDAGRQDDQMLIASGRASVETTMSNW